MFKKALLTLATAASVIGGSAMAQPGGDYLIETLLQEGVEITVEPCKGEDYYGRFKFYPGQWRGREIEICTNVGNEAMRWETLRHEAVHVAQHCRDPHNMETIMVDGWVQKNHDRSEWPLVRDGYPRNRWDVEMEAFTLEDYSNEFVADMVKHNCG